MNGALKNEATKVRDEATVPTPVGEETNHTIVEGRDVRRRVFERVRMATVGFGVFDPAEKSNKITGSGVVVHEAGVVITAKHVLENLYSSAKKLRETIPDISVGMYIMQNAFFEGNRFAIDFRIVPT